MYNDDELERLGQENLKIAKENNKILKKIYRQMKLSRVFKAIYWALIIGSALGLYYAFQPIIDSTFNKYDEVRQQWTGFMDRFGSSDEGTTDEDITPEDE